MVIAHYCVCDSTMDMIYNWPKPIPRVHLQRGPIERQNAIRILRDHAPRTRSGSCRSSARKRLWREWGRGLWLIGAGGSGLGALWATVRTHFHMCNTNGANGPANTDRTAVLLFVSQSRCNTLCTNTLQDSVKCWGVWARTRPGPQAFPLRHHTHSLWTHVYDTTPGQCAVLYRPFG